MARISTPITEMFGIEHPILLAGMNVAAGPELAAAVSNAGGLGVIGGLGYTPKILRQQIQAIKKELKDPNLLSELTCYYLKSVEMPARPITITPRVNCPN